MFKFSSRLRACACLCAWLCLSSCAWVLGAVPLAEVSETEALPEVLPPSCELDLALSAAPEYLRDTVSVYALVASGYRKVVEGSGPFTCIVNRDHPRVLKPTCFDAEGTRTIVPKILFFGERLMAGTPLAEIRESVARGFESGRFESPSRAGVAYMLSRYNRPYNSTSEELLWFPPHVMFYAPHLTNEDIGHSMAHHDPNRPLPMIGYQGPQGYMIMISDDGQPRSRADLRHCPDWVHAD